MLFCKYLIYLENFSRTLSTRKYQSTIGYFDIYYEIFYNINNSKSLDWQDFTKEFTRLIIRDNSIKIWWIRNCEFAKGRFSSKPILSLFLCKLVLYLMISTRDPIYYYPIIARLFFFESCVRIVQLKSSRLKINYSSVRN